MLAPLGVGWKAATDACDAACCSDMGAADACPGSLGGLEACTVLCDMHRPPLCQQPLVADVAGQKFAQVTPRPRRGTPGAPS